MVDGARRWAPWGAHAGEGGRIADSTRGAWPDSGAGVKAADRLKRARSKPGEADEEARLEVAAARGLPAQDLRRGSGTKPAVDEDRTAGSRGRDGVITQVARAT